MKSLKDEKEKNKQNEQNNKNKQDKKSKQNRTTSVIVLAIAAGLIVLTPLLFLKNARFEGSDSAGSEMVSEITGGDYEPWASPVLESLTGSELSREMETLFFCIQTGIGVGIIAFCFGYLAARKKYGGGSPEKNSEENSEENAEEKNKILKGF